MDHVAFLKAFLGLFAMMNPIGNTGIFISMTGDLPARFKAKAALKVTIVVLIILIGAVFGGTAILNAFGISLPAFQLAGGLIVLGIGFNMLKGGENKSHATPEGKKKLEDLQANEAKVSNALIVPLSMPILGGPGSITTVVTVAAAYPTLSGQIGAAAGTAALTLIMGVCFALSGLLQRFITPHAQQIILRFMGMILVAIAADMMLTGFQQSVGGGVKRIIPDIVDEVDAAQTARVAEPDATAK
ncbi:MAG: MarC family protein [Phycisphaeraceae bacterium]|nr:MarC family protein [Phycisphaeraceae bacterium]MCP4068257.1 MarC family protein [Phycisphaeraceae bacterium]MCP4497954.1 MarC family protein [Phycisphaeraceae bacterium]MCP4796385.1 MarC family protein [Phycisphaeraceae bacterium]MCP4937916.1 MarC family protein [Phycisphaeraceae bacterium]